MVSRPARVRIRWYSSRPRSWGSGPRTPARRGAVIRGTGDRASKRERGYSTVNRADSNSTAADGTETFAATRHLPNTADESCDRRCERAVRGRGRWRWRGSPRWRVTVRPHRSRPYRFRCLVLLRVVMSRFCTAARTGRLGMPQMTAINGNILSLPIDFVMSLGNYAFEVPLFGQGSPS